jgi:dTDP-4-dehydrorhamnose 3,5-epimerase-like enzyme
MKVVKVDRLGISDVLLLTLSRHVDERGTFSETKSILRTGGRARSIASRG